MLNGRDGNGAASKSGMIDEWQHNNSHRKCAFMRFAVGVRRSSSLPRSTGTPALAAYVVHPSAVRHDVYGSNATWGNIHVFNNIFFITPAQSNYDVRARDTRHVSRVPNRRSADHPRRRLRRILRPDSTRNTGARQSKSACSRATPSCDS
jgi:hypothetical protein